MRLQKRLPILFLAICLLFAMGVTAYAHETPDVSKTGSISVAMTHDGEAVPGGTLTLYQVGEIAADNGNYSFVLTGRFRASGVSLEDISSAELAESLAAYASANGLTGIEVEIGEDGTAVANTLPLGLYLAVQTEAAGGYEPVEPFLASVPMYADGNYQYDVDATPKMSLLQVKTPEPSAPVPAEPTLPQTGQLNWPVPVLAVAGLCLFALGWLLRFKGKENGYAQ